MVLEPEVVVQTVVAVEEEEEELVLGTEGGSRIREGGDREEGECNIRWN